MKEIAKFNFAQKKEEILGKYRDSEHSLIEFLFYIKDCEQNLTDELLEELESVTGIPKVKILKVVSYYDDLLNIDHSTEAFFCTGIICSMHGSEMIYNDLDDKTKKRLIKKNCLGHCEYAPCMQFGDEIKKNILYDDVLKVVEENI